MAWFRSVRPIRSAAWEAGSPGPTYASTSTMVPSTGAPPTVERSRHPRRSRATVLVSRRKNSRGRGLESSPEKEERHAGDVPLFDPAPDRGPEPFPTVSVGFRMAPDQESPLPLSGLPPRPRPLLPFRVRRRAGDFFSLSSSPVPFASPALRPTLRARSAFHPSRS